MRIECRYSGVAFYCQGFNQLKVIGQHPLMEVPVRNLISRARDWRRGNLDDTERRLLFIAMLKATDHVEFRVPAIPTKQTIESNMELLFNTLNWQEGIGDNLRLPKYRVIEDNRRIKNIGQFLANCNDEKRIWDGKTDEWRLVAKLQRREDALLRLLRSPLKATAYLRKLARWVVDASGAPGYAKEDWVELFSTENDLDIWAIPTVDIEEMLEWMQDHLQYGGIVASHAFRHVYELLEKNKKGIKYSLMDDDSEEAKHKYLNWDNNPFLILDEEPDLSVDTEDVEFDELTEAAEREKNRRHYGDEFRGKSRDQVSAEFEESNKRRIIGLAPIAEPRRENYPTQVAYIKDFAAYRIAVRELKKQQEEDQKKREAILLKQREAGATEKLDLPFSDIDPETDNIINIANARARSSKDE